MAVHAHSIAQPATAAARRPAVVAVLSVVTLGIYSIFWYYWINREMRDFGAANNDARLAASRPMRSVLAYTLGALVLVPAAVSLVRATGRLQSCKRLARTGDDSRSVLLWLLGVVYVCVLASIAFTGTALVVVTVLATAVGVWFIARMQSELNAVWRVPRATGGQATTG
jgi:hypothetical protein